MPETKFLFRLMRGAGQPVLPLGTTINGLLVALGCGAAIILLANIAHHCFAGTLVGESVRALEPTFFDLVRLMPEGYTQLAKLGILLLALAVDIVVLAAVTAVYYRLVAGLRASCEAALLGTLGEKGKQLAHYLTVTGHRRLQQDCLEYHLPRAGLAAQLWWRTVPRAPLIGAVCLLLVFAVDPLMAALTLVAAGLAIVLVQILERRFKQRAAVRMHRVDRLRREVVELASRGPLVEMVHGPAIVQGRFGEELERYRQGLRKSIAGTMWRVPAALLMGGSFGCLLLFVSMVRAALTENALSPAPVVLFVAGGSGLWWATHRLRKLVRELRSASAALEQLDRYLGLPLPAPKSGGAVLQRVGGSISLQDIVLEDVAGQRLLDGATVALHPQSLIGIVSIDPTQAQALVELVLGLGRPKSGRMMIDGQPFDRIDPESFRRRGHWVAADGALLLGTLRENLADGVKISDLELTDCIKEAGLEETLRQLDEGLSTVITPDDERLPMEMRFRIGLARGLLRRPDVCAIEEPPSSGNWEVDERTLATEKMLSRQDAITLVLPRRLATLRNCDRIVLLDGGRVVDEGSHGELLKRCELYRHFNYLRFNAIRRPD